MLCDPLTKPTRQSFIKNALMQKGQYQITPQRHSGNGQTGELLDFTDEVLKTHARLRLRRGFLWVDVKCRRVTTLPQNFKEGILAAIASAGLPSMSSSHGCSGPNKGSWATRWHFHGWSMSSNTSAVWPNNEFYSYRVLPNWRKEWPLCHVTGI